MSLFKKLIGGAKEQPAPAPVKAAAAGSAASAPLPSPKASELLGCEGIDWNGAAQLPFLRETLPKWRSGIESLAAPAKDEYRLDNPYFSPADAAVMYAMVCERRPTRLIEVGCGFSTLVIRRAFKALTLPCELIAVDPEPRADIGEAYDAHLAQPVQELPLSDFDMLQSGEMLVLDMTHIALPGSDVEFVYARVLPRLKSGVMVCVNGVRLPRGYNAEELKQGFNEQSLLQMYLTGNSRVEILYAGSWLAENHADALKQAIPFKMEKPESKTFWFRIK